MSLLSLGRGANYLSWVMVPAMLVIVGCGGQDTNPPTRERLESRVRTYWEHRLERDWVAVYEMLTPQERDRIKRQTFLEGRSDMIRIVSYEIESLDMDGNSGESTAVCRWRMSIPNDKEPFRESATKITDLWIFVEGDWYLDWSRSREVDSK